MAVSPSKINNPPPPDASPFAKNLSKFGKFWLTPKGRNYVGVFSGLAAAGYFTGYVALHSWILSYYKDAVQLYKNGFVTPLTADVFERGKKALAEMRMDDKERQTVRFFTVYGMDLFYAGSTKTRQGCIIGIPRNYSYKSNSEIEKNDIVVENHNVEWGSDGGVLLQDALVLSDNAQKFGIARNIAMADTYHIFVHATAGSLTILLYYFLSHNANNMLYGLYKPRSFRAVVYGGIGTFCYGLWAVSRDMLSKFYENYADRRAGTINLSYAKGGVEFYSKTLQRNMALRSIMGPSGEKMFTLFGNDVEFIRERHVPYTRRKLIMEKTAERLAKSDTASMSSTTGSNPSTATDPLLLKT